MCITPLLQLGVGIHHLASPHPGNSKELNVISRVPVDQHAILGGAHKLFHLQPQFAITACTHSLICTPDNKLKRMQYTFAEGSHDCVHVTHACSCDHLSLGIFTACSQHIGKRPSHQQAALISASSPHIGKQPWGKHHVSKHSTWGARHYPTGLPIWKEQAYLAKEELQALAFAGVLRQDVQVCSTAVNHFCCHTCITTAV